MPAKGKSTGSEQSADCNPKAVRDALHAVISSEELASSPRLKQILSYIVEERLAGRGDQIRGKTIAADVYGRALDGRNASDNIVRVEARRLRRVLDQFYEGSGRDENIRIHVDAGTYVPRFELREDTNLAANAGNQATPVTENTASVFVRSAPPLRFATVAGVVVALVAGGVFLFQQGATPPVVPAPVTDPQVAVRSALMEKSPVSVQSMNLAEQARGLLFPVFDAERQRLAISLFDRAIALDPSLPDGYAGKAQALATLAFLAKDDMQSTDLMQQAASLASRARELGPTSARAHGATAWIASMSGGSETARKHANIAVGLMPDDGYILDIDGVVAILAGDGARAAKASDPERLRLGKGRFGAPNIWGVANYMLGNYDTVIDAFETAPAAGAPVSAPSLIFLAAAHDHLGNTRAAANAVRDLRTTWPDFPVPFVLDKMFAQKEFASDIYSRLEKNGYERAGIGIRDDGKS
ncbi:tetratricopeptide repeat protein [Roseibium sp.]|uniref:tetratricopeptide repeat protein n=1 Tax=Roseibium sp. TaxID=1936156 RepID=UPI003BAA99A3